MHDFLGESQQFGGLWKDEVITSVSGKLFWVCCLVVLFLISKLAQNFQKVDVCNKAPIQSDVNQNCKALETFCFVLVWESTCGRSGNVNWLFFSFSLFPLFFHFRMYVFGGWVPQSAGGEISTHDGEWKCTGSFAYLNLG